MIDILRLNAFPIHMLIDKQGHVAGICTNVKDLKETLAVHFIAE